MKLISAIGLLNSLKDKDSKIILRALANKVSWLRYKISSVKDRKILDHFDNLIIEAYNSDKLLGDKNYIEKLRISMIDFLEERNI